MMRYPFVAQVFDGDWFDAAQVYRAWATKQFWCRRGPLHKRTDIPDWFKNVMYMFRADTRRGGAERYRQMLDDAILQLGPPAACHWYWWMDPVGGKKHSLLDYLPPRKGVANAWRGAKERDIHIFPYVNVRICNTDVPSFQKALPYTSKDVNGKLNFWRPPELADLCRATPWYQRTVADVCEKLVEEYGVAGLYLDQLGAAYSSLCFDSSHGHPLGGGTYLVNGSRAIFQQVRKRVGTGVPVLSEASSEENIDVSAGKIIHYNLWPGFVPLFTCVYHDYWTFYGRNVGERHEDAQRGFMGAGYIFTIGGQIGRIWPGRIPKGFAGEGDEVAQAQYIKTLIAARRAGAKFLVFGRMLRPLRFEGEMPEVSAKLRKGGTAVIPAILSSVWRAPDNEVGLVFTNVCDRPIELGFRLVPGEYGFAQGQSLTLRPVVGTEHPSERIPASPSLRRMRLDAHDVRILAISAGA